MAENEPLISERGDEVVNVKRGDIVQFNPEDPSTEIFGGCLFVVDEVKDWGVQCYCHVPGKGLAWYRAKYSQFRKVGVAYWVQPPSESSNGE